LARKKSTNLTEAEQRPMEVLWTRGFGTVSEVAEALPKKPALAYNTILTTLRILEDKGYLLHTKHFRWIAGIESTRERKTERRRAATHPPHVEGAGINQPNMRTTERQIVFEAFHRAGSGIVGRQDFEADKRRNFDDIVVRLFDKKPAEIGDRDA